MKAQILLRGEIIVERRVLKHESDRAADIAPLPDNIEAVHRGEPAGWLKKRAQHVDRRRLAGAIRAEKAKQLAFLDA